MKTITFSCETVTPLFLGGADAQEVELRAPSIKGALRFWWRAMHGDLSLSELKQRESAIFGGTEKGQGRSKVIIRVPNKSLSSSERKLVPHKNFTANSFEIEQEFIVKLCLTEVVEFNKERLFIPEQLKALFLLTCSLGGFGKRSRRGMGSIRIKKIDGEALQCTTLKDIFEYLEQMNKGKFEFKNNLICSKFERPENYPYIKQIQLGNKVNNDYLWKISNTTHELKKKEGIKKYEPSLGYASNNKRFASPIYVSIITVNNELRPIITTLNAVPSKGFPDNGLQKEFIDAILYE